MINLLLTFRIKKAANIQAIKLNFTRTRMQNGLNTWSSVNRTLMRPTESGPNLETVLIERSNYIDINYSKSKMAL